MEKHNKYAVMLAALLHDIGKIRWSATGRDETASGSASAFFDAAFVVQQEARELRDEVLKIIEGGTNPILDLVRQADVNEERIAVSETGFKRKPLLSILSLIETTHDRPHGLWYYKPGTVDIERIDPLFAENIKDLPADDEMKRLSDEIYNRLIEDVKALPEMKLPALIETLLFLFEKHLTTVSSAKFLKKPDISLFDHLKTTTALASCIAEAEDGGNPFLIVAADISGIQSFIYSETNPIENSQKGRSKQFRGKSFYLTLLTDTFSSYLLRETGMSSANLLINGGGHFVLVVPNSEDNRRKITEARKKIQLWFYRTYKGELNLILETLEANDSLYSNFSKWYGIIANKLTAAKKQRSIGFLGEIFNTNLDNADFQYRMELLEDEKNSYNGLDTYEKFLFCLTKMFSDIGTVLPRAKYIVKRDSDTEHGHQYRNKAGLVEVPFRNFGITWVLASESVLVSSYLSKEPGLGAVIYSVNNFDLPVDLAGSGSPGAIALGAKLVGNHAPFTENNDSIMEFPELAVQNAESGSKLDYSVLAVLRMDVDNLGSIFSFGLERNDDKESIRSLSRTVNLSRALNLFFTGHINTIARKWQIYITYSGGDDLFVVGSWINVLNFAFELREAFSRFACGNRNLTISAGIYICRDSYPVHKAANHAGEAESRAKGSSPEKDSISIFGREYRWSKAKELINYGREIDSLVVSEDPDEQVTSAYIHFLLGQTSRMFDKENNFVIDEYFRNMFKIKYSLARKPRGVNHDTITANKNNPRPNKKVALLSRLINSEGSMELIKDFVVPASYVILKNRKNK